MCAGPNRIIRGSHLNSTWVPPKEYVGPTWAPHEQYMGPTWATSHGVAPNLGALVYVVIHGSKAYYISWAIYLALRVSWVRFTHPTHVQELGPILLKYCSRASHHTSHTARNPPWAPRRKVSLSPNSPTTPWQRKNSVLLPDKGAGGVDHDERTRTATHSHAQPGSRSAHPPQPRSPASRRAGGRPWRGRPTCRLQPPPTASGCLQWTDD